MDSQSIFCKATFVKDIKELYLVLWGRPHVHELFPLRVSHSGQRWSCSNLVRGYAIEVLLLQPVSHLPLSFFEQIRKCLFHWISIHINGELTLEESMNISLNKNQMMSMSVQQQRARSSTNKCRQSADLEQGRSITWVWTCFKCTRFTCHIAENTKQQRWWRSVLNSC